MRKVETTMETRRAFEEKETNYIFLKIRFFPSPAVRQRLLFADFRVHNKQSHF